MELTSTSRADHLQGNRPQLVVTEVVHEPLFANDPTTPKFVEMINQLALIGSGGRGHQRNREGPTNHGGHLGESPSAVSQLAQSGAKHCPHCRCEDCLTPIRGDPGPKSFDDKEWITFALAPEPCR